MHIDPAVVPLLAPVRTALDAALDAIGARPTQVCAGPVAGFWELRDGAVVLSETLLGPALHHPEERADLPLDRWRRAMASVLEAAALGAIPPGGPPWARLGRAIDAADRALPEARLADPDVLTAIATGDLDRWPRGGVAVVRAWRALDLGPWISEAELGPELWARLARWVLDPSGAGAALPVSASHPAEAGLPLALGPWSFRPVALSAHPRGGKVQIDGEGVADPAFLRGGQPYVGLASTTTGAAFSLAPIELVGRWELRSAQGFASVFGARGMTWVFRPSGRLEIELADAFVGPLGALGEAARMGTSGVVTGAWRVEAADAIVLDALDPRGIASHGRSPRDPVFPADQVGMGPMLRALSGSTWRWTIDGERLLMRGGLMGGSVEMRLVRVAG